MTTLREEFEEWAKRHLGQGYSLDKDEGVYISPVTRWAEKAYQAATERAARICDGLVYALDNGGNRYRREADASKCAAAIRAASMHEGGGKTP